MIDLRKYVMVHGVRFYYNSMENGLMRFVEDGGLEYGLVAFYSTRYTFREMQIDLDKELTEKYDGQYPGFRKFNGIK